MTTRKVVVDTSALLATFEGGASEEMERLQARAALTAPAIMAFELGNVVHRKRRQLFGKNLADRQALVDALLLGVEIAPTVAEDLAEVGRIAEEDRLTFYDAAFLALAARTSATLLTEDAALAKAAASRLGK